MFLLFLFGLLLVCLVRFVCGGLDLSFGLGIWCFVLSFELWAFADAFGLCV